MLDAKRALRDEVWTALTEAGVGRFPGARNRIPNFRGAEQAAERLRATTAWRAAAVVKANPDSPQLPVRQRALEDGLLLYMAVPRLAGAEPFVLLDPATLAVAPRAAASIKGSGEHGVPVGLDRMRPVDLVVSGCVAVDRAGARLGKGGGFADLELALAAQAGLITDETVIATTVHPCQILEEGRIPMTAHDARLDLIVTPDEVITCPPRPGGRPAVQWSELTPTKIAAIPVLAALAEAR